jgi:hypothetical protein
LPSWYGRCFYLITLLHYIQSLAELESALILEIPTLKER